MDATRTRSPGDRAPRGVRGALVLVVLGVLAAGAVLRVLGLDFGLPFPLANVDETIVMDKAMGILDSGDPNPHYFVYPALAFYVYALALGLWGLVAVALGQYESLATWRAAYFLDPTDHILAGRCVTVLLALASILAVMKLGREVARSGGYRSPASRRTVGLVAGLILAVDVLHAHCSRSVTTDVLMCLLGTLCLAHALRHQRRGRGRDAVLAAVLGGLAASTKYYGVLLAVPITVAVLLRAGEWREDAGRGVELRRRLGMLVACGGLMIGAFVLGSPFLLAEPGHFLEDITWLEGHLDGRHMGQEEGRGTFFYLRVLVGPQVGWYLCGAAAVGMVALLVGRNRRTAGLTLLSYLAAHLALISSYPVSFERYLAPFLPVLAAVAAYGLATVATLLPRLGVRESPLLRLALVVILALPFLDHARRSREEGRRLTLPDTRVLMVEWIRDHVPDGSRVATDAWLHLPLTLPSLERMLEEAVASQEREDARRGGTPVEPRPAGTGAEGPSSAGLLKPRHLQARIAAARRAPPSPAYEMQLLLPRYLGPRTVAQLRDHGFRWLVLASNRWRRVLRSTTDLPLAQFYRPLLAGSHIVHRVDPATTTAAGPILLLCDLDQLDQER